MTRDGVRRNTVVVTGGAGFIGSELVTQLVQSGRRVLVLDTLVNGRRENLAHLPAALVELIDADVRDEQLVTSVVRNADTVFHLACLGVRHSLHAPQENHAVNATGTLSVLRASLAANVRRVVHVSSSEVYGTAQTERIDEAHPCEPHTVYGASKLAGEAYARAFHRTHGLAVTIVRPFNAYGPRSHHEGDAGEVIPKMMVRALAGKPLVVFGDGSQTRDFTHVSDTARGIRMAADYEGVIGHTVNIGSGREITMARLARRIADLAAANDGAGAESVPLEFEPPRPGDVARLCADVSRAESLLGFRPRIRLDDGLLQLLRWYLSRPQSAELLAQAEVPRAWERQPWPARLQQTAPA